MTNIIVIPAPKGTDWDPMYVCPKCWDGICGTMKDLNEHLEWCKGN